MAISFPTDAQGVATRTQRRVRAHDVVDQSNHGGTWRDFQSNLGAWPINAATIDALKTTGSASPATPLPGKANISAMDVQLGDVDPNSYAALFFLGNLFGAYDKSTDDSAEVWDFNVGGATQMNTYLEFVEDSDVLPRHQIMNALAFSMTLASAANANLQWSFQAGSGRYFFWDDPVQTVGSGSDAPTIVGTASGAWPDVTADEDVFVRVDTVNANDVDISVKVGTAASYSNTQNVAFDAPTRLQDESGVGLGTWAKQIQIVIPSGSTLTALDEFEFAVKRPREVQSFPAAIPLSSVQGYLYADGVLVCDTAFNLTASWENTGIAQCTGGKEGGNARRSGQLQVVATPTRVITELDWQKAAHEGTQISLVLDARSDVTVPSSANEYSARFILPSCRVGGNLFSPEAGGTNDEEALTFTAGVPDSPFNYEGGSYSEAFHAVLFNALSSL